MKFKAFANAMVEGQQYPVYRARYVGSSRKFGDGYKILDLGIKMGKKRRMVYGIVPLEIVLAKNAYLKKIYTANEKMHFILGLPEKEMEVVMGGSRKSIKMV